MPSEKMILIQMSHEEIIKHWKSIMFEGAILTILGVIAFVVPVAFGIAFEMVLGWLFLLGGGIMLYRAIQSNQAPGFWMTVLSALFFMVLGVLIVFHPLQGLVALTLIIAIFFMAEGIAKVIYAFQIRQFANWIWVLISGLCSIAIALIAFTGFPLSSMWFIGVLMGVYLMLTGIAFMLMANQAHKEAIERGKS